MPDNILLILKYAMLSDLLFILKMQPALFLIFFFLSGLKSSYWYYGFFGSILILAYGILLKYFQTAMVPLGADMFGYSVTTLEEIVTSSVQLDYTLFMFFMFPLLVYWSLYKVFFFYQWGQPIDTAVIFSIGIALLWSGQSITPKANDLKNEFLYQMTQNKAAFFISEVNKYLYSKAIDYFGVESGHQIIVAEPETGFQYVNAEYPFLRKEEATDVLGNFFYSDPKVLPNLVFIQVEGLGRAFSGPQSYLGSFTPFLDSLAEKSLYFSNFLSAQGRTFSSLASILASLPFAETGFNDLSAKMPKFYSLVNILSNYGYSSAYYGGFEMNFDFQGEFMKNAGVHSIVSADDFDAKITMASSIGHADEELINVVLNDPRPPSPPHIKYIQTLSMHNPYTIPNQAYYLNLFETHMEKLGFSEKKKKEYRGYQDIYATILYTDKAIERFFKESMNRPEFKHTIFVITGDHRLPEIPLSTNIDRYHVPLLIYSPMLKRVTQIKSISSHLDIAPSLVAYLRTNYHLKTPEHVTWVGSGLDTVITFRNTHSYPLKQGKTVLHTYISGLSFLDNGKLFTLSDNMNVDPSEDELLLKDVNKQFLSYKEKNNNFVKTLKLVPDSNFISFNNSLLGQNLD
ncbi:putative sulfatase [Pedobacter sp. CAN_A7]|uniref:LTA synthase family protein n=1 Tax=Pedobacter sp. CAN_A7 TaxID=2787722 RepID=UPI0018C8F904